MKISTTSERLNQLMKQRNVKQIDIINAAKPFCDKYGIKLTKSDLSQYVSGKVEPKQEKLTLLRMALNVSETWLMGYDVQMARSKEQKEQPLVTKELSEAKQAMYEFVDGLSDEQVHRLLQIARAAFEK